MQPNFSPILSKDRYHFQGKVAVILKPGKKSFLGVHNAVQLKLNLPCRVLMMMIMNRRIHGEKMDQTGNQREKMMFTQEKYAVVVCL